MEHVESGDNFINYGQGNPKLQLREELPLE
jgi:hypothetical protein